MLSSDLENRLGVEARRRRTFAIISHPDAGKTTLTEKILLYAGCIEEAGKVRAGKTTRAVASDWMALERQRGISVSATAMSFEYRGKVVNLLDTPGHHDFSEDTYRTLMAADCAVMLIDAAKGVEAQTRKLFEVCRRRQCPIVTLVNKMDRPGARTLEVLREIEQALGVEAIPLNWPIGLGPEFIGVFDLPRRQALLFRQEAGGQRVESHSCDIDELERFNVPGSVARPLRDDIELLEACTPFDLELFRHGAMTPVFFASAGNNFGIEPFLDAFVELCPGPQPRRTAQGSLPVESPGFSGFVFKLQGNLNPRHREQTAYVRVCSGIFDPENRLHLTRTNKSLRVKAAYRLFGQERQEMVQAYPGDIVAIISSGGLRVGDSVHSGSSVEFEPLPKFPTEYFSRLQCGELSRRKQFEAGMRSLAAEGVIQVFFDPYAPGEVIAAAVGPLQFDVLRFRLKTEYDVEVNAELAKFQAVAWVARSVRSPEDLVLPTSSKVVLDHAGDHVVLLPSEWHARLLRDRNPKGVIELVSE